MGAFKWWTSPPSSARRTDRGRRLLGGFVVLTLGCSALPALALPNDACIKDERCKEHHDKAVTYYSQQYYEEALSEFQAAYAARQMPLLLINIGRTLQKLGRPKEAISYYERFQQAEAKPDPAIQAKLVDYLSQARALVGSQPASATPDPATDPAKVTPVVTLTPTAPAAPTPGRTLLIAGSVMAGLGVVGLVTGIGLYSRSASDFSTFMSSTDEIDQLAAKRSAQAFGNASTAGYVFAGTFAGLGAILIAQGARQLLAHRRATSAPSAALLPGPGGATAILTGAF